MRLSFPDSCIGGEIDQICSFVYVSRKHEAEAYELFNTDGFKLDIPRAAWYILSDRFSSLNSSLTVGLAKPRSIRGFKGIAS